MNALHGKVISTYLAATGFFPYCVVDSNLTDEARRGREEGLVQSDICSSDETISTGNNGLHIATWSPWHNLIDGEKVLVSFL